MVARSDGISPTHLHCTTVLRQITKTYRHIVEGHANDKRLLENCGGVPNDLAALKLQLMQLPRDAMGASPDIVAALRKSSRHAKQLLWDDLKWTHESCPRLWHLPVLDRGPALWMEMLEKPRTW